MGNLENKNWKVRYKMGSVDITLIGIIVAVAVIGFGWLMKEMNS